MAKFIAIVVVLVLLSLAILALANYLGFETKTPRGFVLLTLLDLAVLKAWILIRYFGGQN